MVARKLVDVNRCSGHKTGDVWECYALFRMKKTITFHNIS